MPQSLSFSSVHRSPFTLCICRLLFPSSCPPRHSHPKGKGPSLDHPKGGRTLGQEASDPQTGKRIMSLVTASGTTTTVLLLVSASSLGVGGWGGRCGLKAGLVKRKMTTN